MGFTLRKTASIVSILAFLFSAGAYAADVSEDYCNHEFGKLRRTLQSQQLQMTIVAFDGEGVNPFTMLRGMANGKNYISWEHLSGEIRGYSMRNDEGYNYNLDRNLTGALTFHPSSIWDRIFSVSTPLKGYSCVIAGRTRAVGRKVSLIKLAPQDGLRYIYVVSKDDETDLPVELMVVDPGNSSIVSKYTVIDSRQPEEFALDRNDSLYDKYRPQKKGGEKRAGLTEFNIPDVFRITDSGRIQNKDNPDEDYVFQKYSDGIITFQVVKSRSDTNFIPIASQGGILILKKQVNQNEYAVVGMIPRALAEHILSKL